MELLFIFTDRFFIYSFFILHSSFFILHFLFLFFFFLGTIGSEDTSTFGSGATSAVWAGNRGVRSTFSPVLNTSGYAAAAAAAAWASALRCSNFCCILSFILAVFMF